MRNIKNQKPISNSDKILNICKLIGIEHKEDLQLFKKREQLASETTLQALERYFIEMLEN